jgi:hypothetical protein
VVVLMTRVDKLVRAFAENVIAQVEALQRGDARTGNKHAKLYIRAFQSLRSLGDEGRDALVPLLSEDRDEVRAMTAAFLLRHRHEEARKVLELLSRSNSRAAFSASETLKRWDEGAWQLDPEDG